MKLKKVAKTSLVDEVARQLRETIEKGKLGHGERLPSEPELVRQLGVSRPVLREAIGRLSSLGVLKVVHGRGTFVADHDALLGCVQLVRTVLSISSLELIQFMELRTAIECQAARRAAARVTPRAIAELQKLCRQVHAKGLDPDEAMRRDLKFHLRIVELSDNKLMLDVLQVIQELMLEAMARTFAKPEERRWVKDLHMAIVEGIGSGDPSAAEAAVRTHMEELCKRLEVAREANRSDWPCTT